MESEQKEGWAWPGNSRKAHYFVNGRSLCGKWGWFYNLLNEWDDDSSDNCAACKRKREKRGKLT